MKKKLAIFLVILATILVIVLFVVYEKAEADKKISKNELITSAEPSRMVKVKGKVYVDTGKTSDSLRCGMMDGTITSHVEANETPTEDNQANFEGEYGYQYGEADNTIEVNIDGKWYLFEAKTEEQPQQAYFYGKVVESSASQILVEPNEGEEIRKSADRISVDLGKNNDALYEVGTNVKVTYTGDVMETYPAQVKEIKIEIKSVEEFELRFRDKRSTNR